MPFFARAKRLGIFPSIVPSSIPTLPTVSVGAPVFNLDMGAASPVVFGTGSLVSQWNDQSGNSNHYSQATGGAQPTYVASVYGPFSLPCLRFAGAQYLQTSGLIANLDLSTGVSLVVIAKWASGTNTRVFANSTAANTGFSVQINTTAGGQWRWNTGFTTSTNNVDDSTATGALQMVIGEQDSSGGGAIGSGFYQGLYVDSSTLANHGTQVLYVPNTTGANHPTVGATTTGTAFFTGDVCQVIGYSAPLTNADVVLIHTYSQQKWGTV